MDMWPFARRGSCFDGDADEHFPSDINPRDFKDNKATIKLWLPGKILAGIDIIGQRHHVGRPDVLRAIRDVRMLFLRKSMRDLGLWLPNEKRLELKSLAERFDESLPYHKHRILTAQLFPVPDYLNSQVDKKSVDLKGSAYRDSSPTLSVARSCQHLQSRVGIRVIRSKCL